MLRAMAAGEGNCLHSEEGGMKAEESLEEAWGRTRGLRRGLPPHGAAVCWGAHAQEKTHLTDSAVGKESQLPSGGFFQGKDFSCERKVPGAQGRV